MLKRVSTALYIALVVSCFGYGDDRFTEVCDEPSKIGVLLGPKQLEDSQHKLARDLILKHNKSYTGQSLKEDIEMNGIFASTPYSQAEILAGRRIEKVCVVLATGGAAFNVKRAIEDNKDLREADRINAIRRAVEISDSHCFQHVKELRDE